MPSYQLFLKAVNTNRLQDFKMAALKFTGVVFLIFLAVITKAHAGKKKKCCQTIQSKLDALTSKVETLGCQGTTYRFLILFSLGSVAIDSFPGAQGRPTNVPQMI